ncbi:MAG: U32 family peptidase C-terminal domain-containing protein [Nitrospinaceae bacterium]|nr:MAG: U32 family peptidase C-terminal domain-containing protein [Nitrospinaceae bacterium]
MSITPELLAPAGSPEKMRYAFAYGADAVYAGIPKFSLRARENLFKDETLLDAIDEVHRLGKKIYITANILPPNRKVDSFRKSLEKYAAARPDGLIMSDPGLIQYVLKHFPDVPVHLSVQTNTINWPSVKFWHDLGVRRVILSRELSIEEIAEIHRRVPGMELESFVHGSICIAYSGRCLLSNYFNHRDANQGTCTNSCRWEYDVHEGKENAGSCGGGEYFIEEKERPGELMPIDEDEHGTYIMNSKDLRAIEFLEPLQEAGVMSFKIEGRSKSIYYLSLITRAYRRAIDDLMNNRPFNPELLGEVEKTANRGFTSAFLRPHQREETERMDSPQVTELPQVFAGQVINTRAGGWMEVEVKNRVERGDALEFISPGHQYRFVLEEMKDREGSALDVAHGGGGRVWLRTAGPVELYALLSLIKVPAEVESLMG